MGNEIGLTSRIRQIALLRKSSTFALHNYTIFIRHLTDAKNQFSEKLHKKSNIKHVPVADITEFVIVTNENSIREVLTTFLKVRL